jgi:hypothetical protein
MATVSWASLASVELAKCCPLRKTASGCSLCLGPPPGTVVVSVDGETGIRGKTRIGSASPPGPGSMPAASLSAGGFPSPLMAWLNPRPGLDSPGRGCRLRWLGLGSRGGAGASALPAPAFPAAPFSA